MTNIGKKVGYLKGLMEGMELDVAAPSAKLFEGVVDLLGDLCDRVEKIDELIDDLNDYVESIDDDLSELEGEQNGGMDFLDEDDDEDFDDGFGGEDHLHLLHTEPKLQPKDSQPPLAGVLCPECSRMFFIRLNGNSAARYRCPHCGKAVSPLPLTPENAPIADPLSDAEE